jgi:hypothetical protein
MNFQKLLLGMIFGLTYTMPLLAQKAWIFQKEKDGIKISNRHAEKSPFNDVRVELDLPGTIDQLASILLDIPRYPDWAYATRKSVLMKDLGPGKLIYYSEIDVPWPASDRYFYANFELTKNPIDHSMQVTSENLPDYTPVPKDLLKINFSKGSWNVTTLSRNKIHVDYILQLDPGGSLPAWIINSFSSTGPLETFENIKKKMTALNP